MISKEQAREILDAEFPSWGTYQLNPISGGLTNQNLLIETDEGEKFVARLPGKDTDKFGIDRKTEHAISRAAWEIGIAPEPVSFLSGHEILVTRFVEGFPIDTNDPATIRNVARLLHQLHSAPEVPGVFDLPSVIDDYIATAKRFNVTHPDKLSEALEFSAKIISAMGSCEKVSTPCHNDLLPANFLKSRDQLYLLDWEYAGMGHPYVDLGIAQSTSAWMKPLVPYLWNRIWAGSRAQRRWRNFICCAFYLIFVRQCGLMCRSVFQHWMWTFMPME